MQASEGYAPSYSCHLCSYALTHTSIHIHPFIHSFIHSFHISYVLKHWGYENKQHTVLSVCSFSTRGEEHSNNSLSHNMKGLEQRSLKTREGVSDSTQKLPAGGITVWCLPVEPTASLWLHLSMIHITVC